MESKRITRHIDRLILDPNNYRFIDRSDYKPILEDQLADSRVQQRTYNFITGKNNENISDLVASFKTNGFLNIDQIQVKNVGDDYLILEGNRRVATLKYLYEQYKTGNDIGVLEEADFKSVSIIEILDDDIVQHLVAMGLHHISGKKRWSPVNQAQLVSDLIYKYGKSENEVCESLGISKYVLRRSTRTLGLIEQYKISDWGDQFQTNMYSLFEEVIRNQNIKEWIEWDDNNYVPINQFNTDRFFSWISKNEEVERDENGEEYWTKQEAIITQSRQIRELSQYIWDEKALKRMEESRSISEGYSFSDAVGESKLRNAISNIRNEVQVAFIQSEFMTASDYEEIDKLKDKLDRLIPTSQALILINEQRAAKYFENISSHFTYLEIELYRKITDVQIKNLSRVNIFAGGNNMGKTSILEAVYLLSQLNDLNAFLDLEKYRGKFLNEFHSKWLNKNFINNIELSGIFNSLDSQLNISLEQTEENIDKSNYLSSVVIEAKIASKEFTSSIHLFSNQSPEQRYLKTQILCSAAFTSPYRYNIKLLQLAHTQAVKERYYDKVISFINNNIDDSIQSIDLVSDEGENRFMVTSSKVDKVIDLTKYGEGLQRVFEIALLIGYCKNGILCIDEVDSGLHKNLLIKFTEFLQRTADEFNVQVFLSTHSKECIDAFVENNYPDDNLTAFALSEENNKIVCRFLKGNKLKQLVDTINIDIR